MYDELLRAMEQYFDEVKVLKRGARGTVTLVRHRQTGQRYVFRRFDGAADVYRRLLTVSSPYLPRVEEVAESHGRVAALEEYVQGDTLLYLLEGGLLDWPEARKVARDLCAALWVLHSMGAVHRDVKESNVILRGGEAVLIDFDASRIMKPELHSDTVILGTTGYAAPEQFGLSQTDGRADIYSLGVLLNVMLTGQHPSRLLAHEHEVTSACTYNDIIWTLHMKTGDKITLRQVEECSEKQRRTVSWEDTPMDTTADLQALLDDLTLNLDAETELVVELPSVTYTEPLTIRRAMTLQAHADGTEFTAPITVNHMAYSEVTDIHVVLSGLRLCGAGDMTGTGVTAKAPTYLNNCWITNWDVGALAADGGWIWVEKSSFTRNATALRIDTTESSSWGSDLHGGNFIRNGTALDIQRMPGEWMTYYVHNSTFTDNDTVIAGPLADQVRLEDGNYVQQSA